MTLGIILTAGGGALMLLGVCFLWEWLGGDSKIFEPGGKDDATQVDWVIICLRFCSLVLAPIFFGACCVLLGVSKLV